MKSMENGDKTLGSLLNGREEEKKKNKLLVFLKDTEEFLSMDGEKLGPFKSGEIANLPVEIAGILISDGKAEAVEDEE